MARFFWLGTRRWLPTQVRFNVDRPVPGQSYSMWLDVEGWALSLGGYPLRVDIQVGAATRSVSPSLPRPDIAAKYPNVAGSGASGFRVRLPREELPDTPTQMLQVSVVADGETGTRPIGRPAIHIAILRSDTLLPSHSRADYGTSWDELATSERSARAAVAGTVDADEFWSSGTVTAADVAQETSIGHSDVVLEIGCGTGRIGKFLAPQCGKWIGADASQQMLSHARKALSDHDNVELVLLNGYDLSGIRSESVDVVYCTAVFMHLDEWDRYRYVREGYRVLKRHGRIWIDNIDLLSAGGWRVFEDLAGLDPHARPAQISKVSTAEELRTYVEKAGFDEIRVRRGGIFVSVFGKKLR